MDTILTVKNLTKTFTFGGRPPITAVKDVSFTLGRGEVLGVVGSSGCGKSTLAKLITRLIEPTSGAVVLDDVDVTKAKPAALRRLYGKIQMVFQTPQGSFDPRRTLGDGIGESLKNRGVAKREIQRRMETLLAQCGLSAEYAGRYPHEVSGGECQRAAIARALIEEPEIVICDEATSALDVTVQQQIMALLQSLQRDRGLAILFICHNFALVQQFCDRLLVMSAGELVEEGTPDEVIFHPKTDDTRVLIDAIFPYSISNKNIERGTVSC